MCMAQLLHKLHLLPQITYIKLQILSGQIFAIFCCYGFNMD